MRKSSKELPYERDHRRPEKILPGSQNWSNDGVSVNRDAGQLFEDEQLAAYFVAIFDHDWNALAKQSIGKESLPVTTIESDEKTPDGWVRLTWKEYFEIRANLVCHLK